MKSPLERERELPYKLLSEAHAKKEGYGSLATRRTLSDSMTALCPGIMPYDWQVDLAEALTLGLDTTVIARTGSGKTLPWAIPLLLEQDRDRICLVISPLNKLEADHLRRGHMFQRSQISPSCFGPEARFFTDKLRIPAVASAVNSDTWNA